MGSSNRLPSNPQPAALAADSEKLEELSDASLPSLQRTLSHSEDSRQAMTGAGRDLESGGAAAITKNNMSSTAPAIPPPDVGLMPWLQVLGGFFLMFNSWGIVVSYGTFHTYYLEGGITDESSTSTIAWVGSLQAFLMMMGGALAGKFLDAGYFRPMMMVGTVLTVFGLMMVSLASKYYQFMLAQAVVVGIGMGLYVIIALSIPATWFAKHRGLAVGIVSAGASIAGIIFPIMLHSLIPRIGFGWAVRIMGFITLATQLISILTLRQRMPSRKGRALLDVSSLKQPAFAMYVGSIFLTFLGFFMFFTFVEAWAIATGVDMHGLPVFYILPIVNAASIFGRILPALASDYIGPLNTQFPAIALASVMVLVWIPTHTLAPLMVIAVLFGFFSGTLVSLPPQVIAGMTDDLSTLGGRIGLAFLGQAFGSLIGNPVTGAIVQAENGSYDAARIWSGVIMLAGAALTLAVRVMRAGWKVNVKA